MNNQVRNEESPAYDIYTGLPLDGFEVFTVEEQQVLLEAQRIIEERYLRHGEALRSPDITKQFLRARLAGHQHEVFGVIWLDNRHRAICCKDLFTGTIDGAAVYPREVVKSALSVNAAAGILYHNHPSGVPDPSQADIALTRRLKEALGLVDIRVLDHMVTGGAETVSLAERGLM